MQAKVIPLVLCVGVLISGPTVSAQDAGLAERVVELTRFEQSMDVLESAMVQGIRQGWMNQVERIRQSGSQRQIDRLTNALPKFETVIKEEMRNFLAEILPELKARSAAFYAERLSREELEELVAALQLPSVQKMFDLQPEVGQIGTEVALQSSKTLRERTRRRLGDLIQESLDE
ncbi:MAG: hypothetical protein AAGA21_15945 [Pseudomonadota bacterium]